MNCQVYDRCSAARTLPSTAPVISSVLCESLRSTAIVDVRTALSIDITTACLRTLFRANMNGRYIMRNGRCRNDGTCKGNIAIGGTSNVFMTLEYSNRITVPGRMLTRSFAQFGARFSPKRLPNRRKTPLQSSIRKMRIPSSCFSRSICMTTLQVSVRKGKHGIRSRWHGCVRSRIRQLSC